MYVFSSRWSKDHCQTHCLVLSNVYERVIKHTVTPDHIIVSTRHLRKEARQEEDLTQLQLDVTNKVKVTYSSLWNILTCWMRNSAQRFMAQETSNKHCGCF